jgi:hypothetical protein
MSKLNPFSTNRYNLGVESDNIGMPKEEVDRIWKPSTHLCTCCNGVPDFRIMPKDDSYSTIELDKGVYICKACVARGGISPSLYALRPIKEG